LKKEEYNEWNNLVASSPQGTIFSESEWLSITSKQNKINCNIIGCFFENQLVGGCPLFYKKVAGLFNFISNTSGMMPYSGIIIDGILPNSVRKAEQKRSNILLSMAKYFKQLKCISLKIQNPPRLTDIRPFTWKGWKSAVRYTYMLDLPNINYSRDVTRNINKAVKNAISVEKSHDIDNYYALFQKTFERQELNVPVSKIYLQKLFEHILKSDVGDMWVAKTPHEEWIAAEIFLHDNNYIHRWTAATDPDLRKNGGYHLLLDTVFKNYQNRCISSTVNLMAANTPQLAEFITGFNPYLVPYYSLTRPTIYS